MAITISIVKNSAAYTNMRIFRSLAKATVYTDPVIADVVISDTYIDDTAVSGQVYYYGVELYNGTDKTQFSAIKSFTMTDFGPMTATVQNNITNFGSQLVHGDCSRGVILKATLAQFSSIPGIPNMKTKLESLSLAATGTQRTQSSTDSPMTVCVIDGKLVVLPTVGNYTANSAGSVFNADILKIRDYLANNPTQALVDIGGYRWKIKLLTKELLVKYPNIINTFVIGDFRNIPQVITDASGITQYKTIYSEADLAVFLVAQDPVTTTFTALTATTTTNYALYLYYEYVGPTP